MLERGGLRNIDGPLPFRVGDVCVGAMVQQQRDNPRVVAVRGPVQRRPAARSMQHQIVWVGVRRFKNTYNN